MASAPTVLTLSSGRAPGRARSSRALDLVLLGLASGFALAVDWRAIALVAAFGGYLSVADWSMARSRVPGAQVVVSNHCIQLVRENDVQTLHREDVHVGEAFSWTTAGGADLPRLRLGDRVAVAEALRRHGWIEPSR